MNKQKDQKKVDIRVKKSKENLFFALIQLLRDDSFDKITVLDICKRASVNRMTFYNHYQDKYDLLNDIIRITMDEVEYQYFTKTNGKNLKNETYECLTVLAEIFIDLLYKYEPVIRNLTTQQETNLASYMLKRTCDETILKIIRESGIIAANDYPIELILAFFSGGSASLFDYWLKNKNNISKEQFLLYLNRAFKAVLTTEVLLKL